MKTHPQANPEWQTLAERIAPQRVAMLTLPNPHSGLQARPMTPLELDAQGCVWMMVSRRSLEKIGLTELGVPLANLAFSHEGDSTYVSITGSLRGVDSTARKLELWSLAGRPWFDGPDDPDLLLLQLQPEQAEMWEGPHSTVVKALAMAASVTAGRPIGLGGHEVIKPPGA